MAVPLFPVSVQRQAGSTCAAATDIVLVLLPGLLLLLGTSAAAVATVVLPGLLLLVGVVGDVVGWWVEAGQWPSAVAAASVAAAACIIAAAAAASVAAAVAVLPRLLPLVGTSAAGAASVASVAAAVAVLAGLLLLVGRSAPAAAVVEMTVSGLLVLVRLGSLAGVALGTDREPSTASADGVAVLRPGLLLVLLGAGDVAGAGVKVGARCLLLMPPRSKAS